MRISSKKKVTKRTFKLKLSDNEVTKLRSLAYSFKHEQLPELENFSNELYTLLSTEIFSPKNRENYPDGAL